MHFWSVNRSWVFLELMQWNSWRRSWKVCYVNLWFYMHFMPVLVLVFDQDSGASDYMAEICKTVMQ